jgi:two-component system, OmpR family, phosphate regulon sensor histidine kinase PhoR
MWPLLTIVAVAAAIGVHLYWLRRHREALRKIEDQQREAQALRDRQELALERAEAQRQALFNSMAEGFLLVDRDGRVQAVNQALKRFFSIGEDFRGKTIMEVFRAHELLAVWEQVHRDGQAPSFELELPGLNSRSFEISAAALPGRFGAPEGSVFIFHDLTRIKQLENTRREFVANVSHELRTPLTLIKGFVETLIDGAKNDPEVADRFLGMIDKHTDRLTFLIEDLLTISKLESGQIVMNMQPTRLATVVERVVEDLQSRADERRVQLRNVVPEEIDVQADGDRLQQVFFNLVDNAIKYGRAEGCVEVGARMREDGMIEAWVKDNGPGIPEDSVERVFERFYRVDRARSREQGGTGLGLAIVKHIVQSHQGEVWLKSVVGEGSTFFFTLPAAGGV